MSIWFGKKRSDQSLNLHDGFLFSAPGLVLLSGHKGGRGESQAETICRRKGQRGKVLLILRGRGCARVSEREKVRQGRDRSDRARRF